MRCTVVAESAQPHYMTWHATGCSFLGGPGDPGHAQRPPAKNILTLSESPRSGAVAVTVNMLDPSGKKVLRVTPTEPSARVRYVM